MRITIFNVIFFTAFIIFLSLPNLSYARPKAKPRIEVKELKIPEVVIKGKDVTLLTDIKKSLMPTVTVSMLKQEPTFTLEDEVKESTAGQKKALPRAADPGCMYSNACVSIFSKATKADEGYYKTAISAYLRKEYTTAYQLFTELIKKYPKGDYVPDAYYWIAEMNYKQYKRPEEAKKFYKVVVNKYPSSRLVDYADYSLAFMYFDEGKYKDARKYADDAFEAKPAGEVAESSLVISVLSLYFSSDYERCLEKVNNTLRIFPESSHGALLTYIKGNIFYLIEQFDKAKKEFAYFLGEFKENEYTVYSLYGLGLSNIKLGLTKDSIKPNEKILTDYQGFKFIDTVMYVLIKAYSVDGKLGKAVTMLNTLETKVPNSRYIENGHYEIAYRYFLKGEYDKARERFLIFVGKYPISSLNGAEYFMLAGAELNLERYVDAVKHYNSFMGLYKDEELIKEARLNSAYAYYMDNMPKEAVQTFEKIVSKYGPAFEKINEVWYFLGESYYMLKDYNKAKGAFSKIGSDDGFYHKVLLGLGWIEFDEGNFEAAIDHFGRYLNSGEEAFLPETYLVLSESHFNLKDYDSAFKNLEKVSTDFPESDVMGKVNYLMGLINFKKGEYETSKQQFSAVLAKHVDQDYTDDAMYWLGWSYFQLGEYDKAATEFTNLVSEYPNSPHAPKAILKIGDSYYNLKRYTSAALSYKSIIEKAPGSDAAAIAEYGIIQALYSQKNYEEIAVKTKEFVKKYPDNKLGAMILLQLAEHYGDVGDTSNAALVYGDMATLYPKSELADDALYKSGKILFKAGETDKALKNFSDLTNKYPASNLFNENNYFLANAYFELGRFKDAIKYYDLTSKNMAGTDTAKESFKKASQAYLKLNAPDQAAKKLISAAEMFNTDPFDRKTYIEVGNIYLKGNKFDQAVSYYKKALDSKFKGVGVSAQMKIADSYYARNDYETALLEYLKIIYLHKSEKDFVDDAYFNIGKLYVMMGKKEEAKKIYLRLQNESLDPDKIGIAIEKLRELGVGGE